MANFARNRKRVYAIPRRAPDGSAFQPCQKCGVSVAIALSDLHECENSDAKRDVKRFRGCSSNRSLAGEVLDGQPLSPFRYFMECFGKRYGDPIDADKKGFEIWKIMSKEERRPYVDHAQRVNSDYCKRWAEEIRYHMFKVDDEADSLVFTKFETDDCSQDYGYGGSDSYECNRGGSSINYREQRSHLVSGSRYRFWEFSSMFQDIHG
ncbi:hypothetical protein LINPERPRIM_LOCUS43193 [Linum perenne]